MAINDYSTLNAPSEVSKRLLTALGHAYKNREILTLNGLKPKAKSSWYSVVASSAASAEVEIYGEIGDWGITAKQFVDDLKALGNISHLNVRINSPGGSVTDGNAIYNAIKRHAARVTVDIDGIALSMGSVIAMAGDYVTMAANGLFMVHNPWGGAIGDADELRKTADVMDKMKRTLISSYVKKTGMTADVISDLMDAETWYDAAEAKAAGFIDEISEEVELAASFDLTKFGNVPKHLLPSGHTDTTKRGVAMTGSVKPEPTVVTDPVDTVALVAKAKAEALAAETTRRKEITGVFAIHGDDYRDLRDECLNNTDLSVADAGTKLLAAIGAQNEPLSGSGRVELIADAKDKFRAAAVEGMSIRMGNRSDDAQNEFRSYSMMDLARHTLEMNGVSMKGKTKMDIVGAAFTHSSSDFPYLLENSLGKELQRAYGAFPETWSQIATVGSVPDFKVNSRIRMGSFNSLDTVLEGGEFTHGTIGEEKETIQASTKGKLISLTRQAIINDDLGGLTRTAGLMGRAAARTVGNDVWAVITANAAMADGTAIFHADHGNLAGTGAAPTVTTLGAARSAMRLQQDLNSNDYLNIMPSVIACPVALEDTMRVLLASETDPASSNSKKPNAVRNMATLVTDPRLDANSTTAWYVFANPQDVPVVEVAFLDGNQNPYLESEMGFTIDGITWKVRMDYGTDSIDHRGGYKNAGA